MSKNNNNTVTAADRVERTLRVPLNLYEEFEEKVKEQYGEKKMNAVIVELMSRFLERKSVMKITPSINFS